MITDDLLIYILFCIIILIINIIGYTRIPLLLVFGLMFNVALSVSIVTAFGDYYMMGILLILLNVMIPIVGLANALRGV